MRPTMKLSEYLAGARGRAAMLSRAVGQSSAYLSQMSSGIRPVRPDVAVLIERATGRQVMRWDLRPDDWHRIWPELIGIDGAPAVTVLDVTRQVGEQQGGDRAAA